MGIGPGGLPLPVAVYEAGGNRKTNSTQVGSLILPGITSYFGPAL